MFRLTTLECVRIGEINNAYKTKWILSLIFFHGLRATLLTIKAFLYLDFRKPFFPPNNNEIIMAQSREI